MNKDYKNIENLLISYAIALDSRNWNLLTTVFHENAIASYGSDQIGLLIESTSRDEIIDMCKKNAGGCGPTQHLLGNFRINTRHNNATSKCYVRAFHCGLEPNQNQSYEMLGEYQDEWKKYDDNWMIIKRKLRVDIEIGNRDKVLSSGE
jgi:3-phenylpropionate/cinnamic acid dioxygenase small subunit